MRKILASTLIALAVSFLFLRHSGLLSQPNWNTELPYYKMQVEAMLHGKLALKNTPYGIFDDSVWGNGVHQIWGLGVPIITLLFEAPARLFTDGGFPDVIQFIICYLLVCAFVIHTVWKTAEAVFPGNRAAAVLIVPAVLLGMAAPIFSRMILSRFVTYEMAVAYACLWTLVLMCLLVRALLNPAKFSPVLFGLVAGFACVIKVTYLFYGVAAVGAVFLFSKVSFKKKAAAALIFALGPGFVIVTNYYRFGSPFEFGYHLNVSGDPENDASLRFVTPYDHEPFISAAKELAGALFFVNRTSPEIQKGGIFYRFQSPTDRERSNDFSAYLWPDFFLFLAGCLIGLSELRKKKFSEQAGGVAAGVGFVGIVVFVTLFVFYLRSPGLCSRYFVDFLPSVAGGLMILYFCLFEYFKKFPFVIVLVAALHFGAEAAFGYLTPAHPGYNGVTSQFIRARTKVLMIDPEIRPEMALPDEYKCREGMEPHTKQSLAPTGLNYDIGTNLNGWNHTSDCMVGVTTSFFLRDVRCLAVTYEPLAAIDTSVVAVRVDTKFLEKISEQESGKSRTAVFCPVHEEPPAVSNEKGRFNFVTIRWVDTSKTLFDPAPLRLLSVKKTE